MIFPTEVNGSLVTDKSNIRNVPSAANAPNNGGGSHPGKVLASYSNQKSLIIFDMGIGNDQSSGICNP